MITTATNEKIDLEGNYPQNTISHCIISNETQITLHFFQRRISTVPEMRANLFLAISNWNVFVYFIIVLKVLLFWFQAGQGLKKVDFSTFFKLFKILNDFE